jgi:signal transduction histidine kinase/ABC-type sugar transport system substrate-binding protein
MDLLRRQGNKNEWVGPGFRQGAYALLTLALWLVAGCRKTEKVVSVLPRSTGTLLWAPFRAGIEEGLHGTPVRLSWEAPPNGGSVNDQIRLLESAGEHRAGLILVPDETLALRSLVLRTVREGTPVVVVDDDFGPPAGPLLSYVSNDEATGARMMGERLVAELKGHGTVAVVGISPRLEGSITREVQLERFVQQIAPGIRFVLRQWGEGAIPHEQQVCQELLDSVSPPDAIVALSATATRGALYAKLASAKPSKTLIVGFDQDDQDMLAPVKSGALDAVVVQNTREIGRRAAQNLLAVRDRRPIQAVTLVPPLLATSAALERPEFWGALGVPLLEAANITRHAAVDKTMAYLRDEATRYEPQPGVEQIGTFIRQPGSHPGIVVQGTVVSLPPMLEVQDDTSAVLVASYHTSQPLRLGDVVSVRGDLTSERFRSRIEQAYVKVLWSGLPQAPLAVTAMQLTANYRGQFIELEGTVLSEGQADGRPALTLQDGSVVFRALLYSQQGMSSQFAPGSRVRLRGTATSLPEATQGLYPFVVIAASVELLRPPPWWSPAHVAMLASAVILLLVGIQWLLHRVQRWHMRSILREREQLAFEMHDTLAQSFTGIAYQLHAARAEKNGGAAVEVHIEHALNMVKMSHREASRTIASLRPQQRDAPGILQALKQSAERMSASGALTVETALTGGSTRLPLEVTEALFRIGQEAISNAIQHGACHLLRVELFVSRRLARLSVTDDGVGFDPDAPRSGLGVTGMTRRAEGVNARLNVQSAPGQGTVVGVVCPLVFTSGLFSHVRAKLAARVQCRPGR